MSKKKKPLGLGETAPEAQPESAAPMLTVDTPRTVAEHKAELLSGKTGREYYRLLAKHDAASTAHGWRLQAYDYPTKPLRLTRSDYTKAIDAAFVSGDGSSPHHPAMYKREA